MQNYFFIVLLVISGFVTSAQNNPIFQGGPGDGVHKITFAQSGNNIFTGGAGDGWNRAAYSQAGYNIFAGGIGDGWNSTTFIQSGNAIFNGGTGDGWNSISFLQAGNAIFAGGAGDGWDKTSFLQPGNNIFNGGAGDGWSSTYRPMGTIPVHFLYFNASKSGVSSSLLNWKTASEINAAYYVIERSEDAVNFQRIGRVDATGISSLPVEYFFTDNNPVTGYNYYRLRQVDRDGRYIFTPARLVQFDAAGTGLVTYYPNPTNGMLHIELPEHIQKESKVINISNTAGVVLNQLKLGETINQPITINMGKYPKSIYFIQVRSASINSTQRIILQ